MFYRDLSEFQKKGLDEDVIQLRFKHYQGRLVDTINTVLEERKLIIDQQRRAQARGQGQTEAKEQQQ